MDANVERFTAIYRQHYPKVLSYALAHDPRAVAEDVANETFLTAWRKLDRVPADDPLPWLFGVARRHRLKQRDAGRRHATIAERARQMRTEHDSDAGEVVAEREAGLAAFAALPERDAEALVLNAWYGFSAGQAARVLGCSTATYFVRLHRARKRLSALLSTSDHVSATHPALEGQRG